MNNYSAVAICDAMQNSKPVEMAGTPVDTAARPMAVSLTETRAQLRETIEAMRKILLSITSKEPVQPEYKAADCMETEVREMEAEAEIAHAMACEIERRMFG